MSTTELTKALKQHARESPLSTLVFTFVVWKTILLLLAVTAPGPGYDTSSLIAYSSDIFPGKRHVHFNTLGSFERLAIKLFRWDAIYFVQAGQRGYVYEQEWAFSWAYNRILNKIGPILSAGEPSLVHYIWAGILMSNCAHFMSVILLYRLVKVITSNDQRNRLAFITAALHILSPAGLFLSAPYAESLFSALNFSSILLYAMSKSKNIKNVPRSILEDCFMLSSGMSSAVATSMRSNGLLNGVIYLYDVASYIPILWNRDLSFAYFRNVAVTTTAGLLVAIGFVGPQWLAYREYCVTSASQQILRPWCAQTIPSIYSWVQVEYWNVGFLQYWSLSNLPLFVIASPMLWLMLRSGAAIMCNRRPKKTLQDRSAQSEKSVAQSLHTGLGDTNFSQLALPQLMLAVMAITNYHVQIVNRISSGYPIWYLVIAEWLIAQKPLRSKGKSTLLAEVLTRTIVMYAIIQGILFANFLPPA